MKENNSCDFLELFHFLGKKWTVILLYKLTEKSYSFNDLKTISKNMISPILLSSRLKVLSDFGLIEKKFYKDRYVYVISEQGKSLSKLLKKFKAWAIENNYHVTNACYETKCCCECLFGKTHSGLWKRK